MGKFQAQGELQSRAKENQVLCDQWGDNRAYFLLFLKGNVIRNIPSLVLESQVIHPSVGIQGRSTSPWNREVVFIKQNLLTT